MSSVRIDLGCKYEIILFFFFPFTENSASLLLHLPVLLTYNHPNNTRIMPKYWKKLHRLSKRWTCV